MNHSINLDNIFREINNFSSEREWDQFHSIKNLAMALSVESSELLEIYQWLSEVESDDLSNTTVVAKATDEVADIFIYLLRIAQKLDINLEEAVHNKLKLSAMKYPVDKSRGRSNKYDQL